MEIERSLKRLIVKEPFYGLFCMMLPRSITKEVSTLAVTKQGLAYKLLINPDFWEKLSDDEQLGVLKHELLHICFEHLLMLKSFPNPRLFNMAADYEVNCYIECLPEGVLLPKTKGWEDRLGTKNYYNKLLEEKNNNPNNSEDQEDEQNTLDDHDYWKVFKDMSEDEKQLMRDQTEHLIKNVADTVLKMRGTIPGELEEIIERVEIKRKPVYNWKSKFRNMLGTIWDVKIKKTKRKESKRYEGARGIRHMRVSKLLVAIDTSGSVSPKELNEFFTEINHIYKAGAHILICECDAKVGKIYEYQGKWNGRITGRGGTDFKPAIDEYYKRRKDLCGFVYLTDGYCEIPDNCPKNMIWVITSDGNHKQKYPGTCCIIPKNDNNND